MQAFKNESQFHFSAVDPDLLLGHLNEVINVPAVFFRREVERLNQPRLVVLAEVVLDVLAVLDVHHFHLFHLFFGKTDSMDPAIIFFRFFVFEDGKDVRALILLAFDKDNFAFLFVLVKIRHIALLAV